MKRRCLKEIAPKRESADAPSLRVLVANLERLVSESLGTTIRSTVGMAVSQSMVGRTPKGNIFDGIEAAMRDFDEMVKMEPPFLRTRAAIGADVRALIPIAPDHRVLDGGWYPMPAELRRIS